MSSSLHFRELLALLREHLPQAIAAATGSSTGTGRLARPRPRPDEEGGGSGTGGAGAFSGENPLRGAGPAKFTVSAQLR